MMHFYITTATKEEKLFNLNPEEGIESLKIYTMVWVWISTFTVYSR